MTNIAAQRLSDQNVLGILHSMMIELSPVHANNAKHLGLHIAALENELAEAKRLIAQLEHTRDGRGQTS